MSAYSFSDSPTVTLEFESSWKTSRSSNTIEIQTDPYDRYEIETQTSNGVEIAVQTDDSHIERFPSDPETITSTHSFSSFLDKVIPGMENALNTNTSSTALKNWDVSWEEQENQVTCVHRLQHKNDIAFLTLDTDDLDQDDEDDSPKKSKKRSKKSKASEANNAQIKQQDTSTMSELQRAVFDPQGLGLNGTQNTTTVVDTQDDHELDFKHSDNQDNDDNSVSSCTACDFNVTGQTIAVGFGEFTHQDWCVHKSTIATWNLARHNLNVNRADVLIDVPSCVICLSYHPVLPSVIAVGTFNGELLIYDTSNQEEPLLAKSSFTKLAHREPISTVEWIRADEYVIDPRKRKYFIATTSSDGKVLFWSMENNLSQPLYGHQMASKSGSSSISNNIFSSVPISSIGSSNNRQNADSVLGVTSLSFSAEDHSVFVMGTENGGVFKCALNTDGLNTALSMSSSSSNTSSSSSSSNAFSFAPSPINFSFFCHSGPIHRLECSPFHRHLFLSCSTDSLKIFNMLRKEPILSLEPSSHYIFDAQWSPNRPMVFAAASTDGNVYIYDLKQNKTQPVVVLPAGSSKAPVNGIAFSSNNNSLATADNTGVIRIWNLSSGLCTMERGELDTLESFAKRE